MPRTCFKSVNFYNFICPCQSAHSRLNSYPQVDSTPTALRKSELLSTTSTTTKPSKPTLRWWVVSQSLKATMMLFFELLRMVCYPPSLATPLQLDCIFPQSTPLTPSPGVLLCKFLNVVKPGVIDPKHISATGNITIHHKTQNLNTAINACR